MQLFRRLLFAGKWWMCLKRGVYISFSAEAEIAKSEWDFPRGTTGVNYWSGYTPMSEFYPQFSLSFLNYVSAQKAVSS